MQLDWKLWTCTIKHDWPTASCREVFQRNSIEKSILKLCSDRLLLDQVSVCNRKRRSDNRAELLLIENGVVWCALLLTSYDPRVTKPIFTLCSQALISHLPHKSRFILLPSGFWSRQRLNFCAIVEILASQNSWGRCGIVAWRENLRLYRFHCTYCRFCTYLVGNGRRAVTVYSCTNSQKYPASWMPPRSRDVMCLRRKLNTLEDYTRCLIWQWAASS